MSAQRTVDQYYEGFTNGGDWSSVAMAENLEFESPMMTLQGADSFRQALAGLATQVKELNLRQQATKGDAVISVYDLDLGAGPIPMAEVLTLAGNEIRRIELIFDKARLAPS